MLIVVSRCFLAILMAIDALVQLLLGFVMPLRRLEAINAEAFAHKSQYNASRSSEALPKDHMRL